MKRTQGTGARPRTIRLRLCARDGCQKRYDDWQWSAPWPRAYCSHWCWLESKPKADSKPRASLRPTASQTKRRPISQASPEQRAAVAGKACVVCRETPTDPAHLIPAGMCPDGDGDPRAVVPLCRSHHRAFDQGGLDLLPFLEPHYRNELAFAVERFGLMSTVRRVTNQRGGT
jgi:hypothetical protein